MPSLPRSAEVSSRLSGARLRRSVRASPSPDRGIAAGGARVRARPPYDPPMRDATRGLRLLFEGQRWAIRHGRDWRFGMIPALITFVGYAAALVALAVWADDLSAWATPFADHWASPWA